MRHAALFLFLGLLANAQNIPKLNTRGAKDHVGEVATVCGHVISSGCNRPLGTTVSFATNDDSRFEFRIPLEDRDKFGRNPEDQYFDRIMCATGRIDRNKKTAQIVVTDPKAIAMTEERPGLPPFFPDLHRPCDPDVEMPKATREAKPQYTMAAMRDRAEGAVLMQFVVEPNGTVRSVRVIRSLHPDLDTEAMRATREWRFEPGKFQGKPVPMVVTMEMSFLLRK